VTAADRRRVRGLLLAVFVPVLIVAGVLATAVLGQDDPAGDRPTPLPAPELAPPAAVPAPPAPAAAPAPVPPPPAEPAAQPGAPPQPGAANGFVPDGADRVDLGEGAQAVSIFRPVAASGAPGPVVILLHGWVAIDPAEYGSWIGHLVRQGITVIFPAYQSRPAYDTTTPLANLLVGVRAALGHVRVAPGRLVVAGHSAGAALAADYAAVAADHAMPVPSAVFCVYPGRKLRHLRVPIPETDLAQIAPGTSVLAFAGERDTAVGSGTARRIVQRAIRADATLRIITDDAVDSHSAPRRAHGAAQRTFWAPLDALVAATHPAGPSAPAP
jgi:acetyl esterase/lipase